MGAVTLFKSFKPRGRVNGTESDVMTRRLLRMRARQIETQQQFEQIIAQAIHPKEVRAMLEPLLRPNLPCCAQADGVHIEGCPEARA